MQFKLDFNRLFGKTAGWFFARGLQNPGFFHGTVRRVLEGHSNNNLPKARQLAIQSLYEYLDIVESCSPLFIDNFKDKFTYDSIKVILDHQRITPIGSGIGLDTDAEGLYPMSRLYGFQITGPVFVEPSENRKISYFDDHRNHNLYLEPTTSSHGIVQFHEKLKAYRAQQGNAVIFASLGGLHPDKVYPDTFSSSLEALAQWRTCLRARRIPSKHSDGPI